MSNIKTLNKIINGRKDVRFNEVTSLIKSYGFVLSRISGSHHIFINTEIEEIINMQSVQGKAKPYQVKQFLKLIERYNLTMKDGE